MDHVAILIPTFRRPSGLRKTLCYVEQLDQARPFEVIVGENDSDLSEGLKVVNEINAAGYGHPLRAIVVEKRGVVHVRNALIADALSNPNVGLVLCIDDDEWPEQQWLRALVEMQSLTQADIVGGTVLPVFQNRKKIWLESADLFRQVQRNGVVPQVWGTCNVLITRSCLERTESWFDPDFSFSGGEDVDYFSRLRSLGARFAWATDAVVRDDIPNERTRLIWLVRRSLRIGGTNTLSQLRWKYGRLGPAIVFLKSIIQLSAAPLMYLRAPVKRVSALNAFCYAIRAVGSLSALFGKRYNLYK